MHSNKHNLARLARMEELLSPQFRAFMGECNGFANQHSLRTFVNWSKIWEYPWLWHNGLGQIDWAVTHLLDLGSEISPMPWFIARQGGKVTLVETDPQWTNRWEQLRAELKVDVDWHIVASEKLLVPDESVDVVTSFSVIEHQAGKPQAMEEIARVLRPGGTLAISFDICEPEMGMTFPDWNGRALTLREFEDAIWLSPAFGNLDRPQWNMSDMAAFKEWHLQSAPHHNYVVGAAVLRKTK
jgi:2-polyprenyl-3-methyl-5-hydroxy-6-metoxy-1,4-benzoquinol methylase